MLRLCLYVPAVSLFIIITTFVLPLDIALADQHTGVPFQDLQDQIDDLSGQLDSLENAVLVIQELAQRVADLEAYKVQAEAKIADLETQLSTETTERVSADELLNDNLNQEQSSRITADEAILIQLEDVTIPEAILALADYVKVEPDIINELSGPHVIFEGANVHIRSGSGSTSDGGDPSGLGNLIIGYNETRESLTKEYLESILGITGCYPPFYDFLVVHNDPYDFNEDPFPNGNHALSGQLMSRRAGSHNLIVGEFHNYNSYGALIGGLLNSTDEHAVGASLLSGVANLATHPLSSIVSGSSNVSSAYLSSILGGFLNRTYSSYSKAPFDKPAANPPVAALPDLVGPQSLGITIVGGQQNQASGKYRNVIVGGKENYITKTNNSVIVGGTNNYMDTGSGDDDAVISGGYLVTTKPFAFAQVLPLDHLAEALVASQGGGSCSEETKEWYDVMCVIPIVGAPFCALSLECDIND